MSAQSAAHTIGAREGERIVRIRNRRCHGDAEWSPQLHAAASNLRATGLDSSGPVCFHRGIKARARHEIGLIAGG